MSDELKPETVNWVKLARLDYRDSLYLHRAARHPNAVYLMCQAIEKLLKGAQVELLSQRPKKIHDLEVLAHNSGLEFSDEYYELLKDLTTHYERVPYRDIGQVHYNTKRKVKPIIDQGKEVYLWIQKRLKNH